MDCLTGFIYGVCITSLLAFMGFLFLDDGEDWGAWLCGPVAWIALSAEYIYEWCKELSRFSTRSLVVCPDEAVRWCKVKDYDVIIEFAPGHKPVSVWQQEDEKWDVKLWRKEYRIGTYGNTRYVPRAVWKRYEPIEKSVIDDARSKYKEWNK